MKWNGQETWKAHETSRKTAPFNYSDIDWLDFLRDFMLCARCCSPPLLVVGQLNSGGFHVLHLHDGFSRLLQSHKWTRINSAKKKLISQWFRANFFFAVVRCRYARRSIPGLIGSMFFFWSTLRLFVPTWKPFSEVWIFDEVKTHRAQSISLQ